MRNQRKNYFIKPGFQAKLTTIILLIVVIVANIVGGIIYALLSGSTVTEQLIKIFSVEPGDLLLPVILIAELTAILIVAFISVFVSHTMAGPVYRFENVLNDVAAGELDSHFQLRTHDEFHELEHSINSVIATLNSKISEIKIYNSNISNLLNDIDSPKSLTVYDLENIKDVLRKQSNIINYFKMLDTTSNTGTSSNTENESESAAEYVTQNNDESDGLFEKNGSDSNHEASAGADIIVDAEPVDHEKLSGEDLIKTKKQPAKAKSKPKNETRGTADRPKKDDGDKNAGERSKAKSSKKNSGRK